MFARLRARGVLFKCAGLRRRGNRSSHLLSILNCAPSGAGQRPGARTSGLSFCTTGLGCGAAPLWPLKGLSGNRGETVSDDVEIDYDYLMQNALRYLMRDVLSMVAELGDAPGEHHFFIEFITGAQGVTIPDHLKETYPERMTIVLQHQFDDLVVTDHGFSVTLWFKGKEAQLKIPFAAVTSFADPSVKFGVRFVEEEEGDSEDGGKPDDAEENAEAQVDEARNENAEESADAEEDAPPSEGADVVSLDSFRKK